MQLFLSLYCLLARKMSRFGLQSRHNSDFIRGIDATFTLAYVDNSVDKAALTI